MAVSRDQEKPDEVYFQCIRELREMLIKGYQAGIIAGFRSE
jgi:hypothetical protein